jgi:hypothetical protein
LLQDLDAKLVQVVVEGMHSDNETLRHGEAMFVQPSEAGRFSAHQWLTPRGLLPEMDNVFCHRRTSLSVSVR